jgi:hypothetical protein
LWDVAAGDEGDGNTHTKDERGDAIGDAVETMEEEGVGEVEDANE